MDAHLHTQAIRHENARRMATAARRHRLHTGSVPTMRPSLRRRAVARLRSQPLPTFAPAITPRIAVVA